MTLIAYTGHADWIFQFLVVYDFSQKSVLLAVTAAMTLIACTGDCLLENLTFRENRCILTVTVTVTEIITVTDEQMSGLLKSKGDDQ